MGREYESLTQRHMLSFFFFFFLALRGFPSSPVFLHSNSIGDPMAKGLAVVIPSFNEADLFHTHFNLYAKCGV